MSKEKAPVTAAVRALRAAGVVFSDHLYQYEDKGGTAVSARELGVDERRLRDDLGIGPCAELDTVHRQVLAGRTPGLTSTPAATTPNRTCAFDHRRRGRHRRLA